MFVNMHTLPPGYEVFTLHVGLRESVLADAEGYEAVVPLDSGPHVSTVGKVIDHVREDLISRYGPRVHVLGIINQSVGEVVFNANLRGQVPFPVVIPPNMAGCTKAPYDLLLSLVPDAIRGESAYRDWLLEVSK